MDDKKITELAMEYGLKCDPENQTLEKQADIRQGFIEGVKQALNIPVVIGCNNLISEDVEKDFQITTRTITIPRDDILWDVNEEVAIYVKNMNKCDDFSEVIKILHEIMDELKHREEKETTNNIK